MAHPSRCSEVWPFPCEPSLASLRELDLKRRLLRHPCSWLIYSDAFDALPPVMLNYVYGRLRDVLGGRDASPAFAHLSSADRQAIREILTATKPAWGSTSRSR